METFAHPLFPFNALKPGWRRIALYGAGDVGQAFAHQLRGLGLEIALWADRRWAGLNMPKPFAGPEALPETDFDCLVIAISDASARKAILRDLELLGLPPHKIVEPEACKFDYAICHPQDLPPNLAGDGAAFARLLAANAGLPWPEATGPANAAPESRASKRRGRGLAIVGTGTMAATMANTVKRRCEGLRLLAVVSRDMGRARAFADRHDIPQAYDSCEKLAENPEIDLVHIATPVFLHHSQTLLFLEHGKHVLCEKPFAVNARQATEMISAARERGLLLADGVWPRYMPMAQKLREVLRSGRIGPIVCLRANLFYHGPDSPRISRREFCGGATLENGAYLMALASLVLGRDVKNLDANALLSPRGVDEQAAITLLYSSAMAVFSLSFRGVSDRGADIYGERGFIRLDNANEYKRISVFDHNGNLLERHEQPSGYEYEARACLAAMEKGQICPTEYPHEETLFTMRMLDAAREAMGVVYPQD